MSPADMDAARCSPKPSRMPAPSMSRLCLMLSYEPSCAEVSTAARADVTAQPLEGQGAEQSTVNRAVSRLFVDTGGRLLKFLSSRNRNRNTVYGSTPFLPACPLPIQPAQAALVAEHCAQPGHRGGVGPGPAWQRRLEARLHQVEGCARTTQHSTDRREATISMHMEGSRTETDKERKEGSYGWPARTQGPRRVAPPRT